MAVGALRERSQVVGAFLQATARGYKYAAEHPEEAAEMLCSLAASDYASNPLPTPLDSEMVKASQLKLSQVCRARGAPCSHLEPPPVGWLPGAYVCMVYPNSEDVASLDELEHRGRFLN